MAIALAPDGIPQRPATGKVLDAPAPNGGPPEGPRALRVSATRQGVTVKNWAGGGVPCTTKSVMLCPGSVVLTLEAATGISARWLMTLREVSCQTSDVVPLKFASWMG